ncbi:MAG TPA: hemerythrin domain-containing protein [Sphingomonas sp.]|nr:hemerythrin domain-containing protein [Sphingomonas sp.]
MNQRIARLREQHDGLRALADTYERELARPEPDLAALARCRWTLARLASSHFAYERAFLYGELARRDISAQALAINLSELSDRLDRHVRQWTQAAITDDWQAYGQASRALIGQLRTHMDREDQEVLPLLDQAKSA